MSIHRLSPTSWLVRVRTPFEGKTLSRRMTVYGTRLEAQKTEIRFRDELAKGKKTRSLKVGTFGEALTYYRENTTADLWRVEPLLNRLDRDLGGIPLAVLTERFSEYWKLLREERGKRTGRLLAPGTRNRILAYGKVALNFCIKRGLIERNPLACFGRLPEHGRDRVLTEEETGKLLEVLEKQKSYLFWPLYFSLKNPIRRGDLESLTRDNLDFFKPWIHFYPSKTQNRKHRETCLPFIDERLLDYFRSLPPECNLLFPRIDKDGEVHPLGEFKRHWHTILEEAGIQDFHWHDLKHCAITWILDNGYSDRDLKNLGIQYTPSMIDRYYKLDAEKVLTKWQSRGETEKMASRSGLLAEKTA